MSNGEEAERSEQSEEEERGANPTQADIACEPYCPVI